MTPLRRLAMKISDGVVRLAPGAKDWARATAREIEFIEDDWVALRWALGSTRILLGRSEIPISSLVEVPQAAPRFAKEIHKRTVGGCVFCVVGTVWFGLGSYLLWNPTQRIGCYLLAGSMLYMAYQLLARRGTLSLRGELPASPNAYRSELERQRDYHCGGWLWSRVILMVPGFLLFCFGGVIALPRLTRFFAMWAAVFLILCVLAVPRNLRVARRYQRRMDDLDVIVKGEI